MAFEEFHIIDNIPPVNEWTRPGIAITPKGLAIHWTANVNYGADAKGNSMFFFNRRGSYGSAHWNLDAEKIYRNIPENEMAYHVGATSYTTNKWGSYPNNELLGLEICVNMDMDLKTTYFHAVRFVAAICQHYGWNPHEALTRHFDVTGKDCPLMMIEQFVNDPNHLDASVREQLDWVKGQYGEAEYEKRVAQAKQVLYHGIDGVNGDDLWHKFMDDVASQMAGTLTQERVVYHMSKYFADLGGHWAEGTIDALHGNYKMMDGSGIFNGTPGPNGTLLARPDATCTRAEVATLIKRGIDYTMQQLQREGILK